MLQEPIDLGQEPGIGQPLGWGWDLWKEPEVALPCMGVADSPLLCCLLMSTGTQRIDVQAGSRPACPPTAPIMTLVLRAYSLQGTCASPQDLVSEPEHTLAVDHQKETYPCLTTHAGISCLGLLAFSICCRTWRQRWWRRGTRETAGSPEQQPGSAGDPENPGIMNSIACCLIFSSKRGPQGNRGMWESYFLLSFADGTSRGSYA